MTHGYMQTGTVSGYTGNPKYPDYGVDDYTAASMAAAGNALFVVNGGCPDDFASKPLVSVVDTDQDQQVGIVEHLSTCNPRVIAITPDGSKAYIATDTAIAIVDVNTRNQIGVVNNLPTGGARIAPTAIAISPDGSKAYVGCRILGGVLVIDLGSDKFTGLVQNLSIPGDPNGITYSTVYNVKFNPDPARHMAYITSWGSRVVAVIDTRTDTQTGQVQIPSAENGDAYYGMDFTPDGATAYVTVSNTSINKLMLLVVDVATSAQKAEVKLSFDTDRTIVFTYAVAVSPDGKIAFALTQFGYGVDVVAVIDTASNTQIATVANYMGSNYAYLRILPQSPIAFAEKDGGTAYSVWHTWPRGDGISIIQFVSLPASITSVSPSTGSVRGGTQLIITGANFTHTTEVDFGGIPGVSLNVKSDSELTVTTPPHDVGPVNVTVVNPGGNATVAGGYTYVTDIAPR